MSDTRFQQAVAAGPAAVAVGSELWTDQLVRRIGQGGHMLGAGHAGEPVKWVGWRRQIGLVQGADAVEVEHGILSLISLGSAAGKVLVSMG